MRLLQAERHRGACLPLDDPHDHVLLIGHDFAPPLVLFVLRELHLHLEALIVLVRHEHDVQDLEAFGVLVRLLARILDLLVPRQQGKHTLLLKGPASVGFIDMLVILADVNDEVFGHFAPQLKLGGTLPTIGIKVGRYWIILTELNCGPRFFSNAS